MEVFLPQRAQMVKTQRLLDLIQLRQRTMPLLLVIKQMPQKSHQQLLAIMQVRMQQVLLP